MSHGDVDDSETSACGFFFFFHSFSSVDLKATHLKIHSLKNANFAVTFRYSSTDGASNIHSTKKYYDDIYPDYVTGIPSGEC